MASIDLSPPRSRNLAIRISTLPVALVLLVLLVASILSALGLLATVPNTFADEAIYIELARHLGASGKFQILGVSFPALTYGPAYVAIIAPIFRIARTARDAYMMIRGLNALIFATATIPTFFIALRAVSRRSAMIVAAAAVALPASAYTSKIMSESLAYPVVLWCLFATVRVIERPTLGRQSALLVGLVITPAVRFELLALAPALALGCAVGANGRIRTRCRTLMPLLTGTGLLTVGAVGLLRATSRTSVGAHGFSIHQFSILHFGALLLGSLGAVDLYAGVLPLASAVLIVIGMRRGALWVSSGVRRVVLVMAVGGSTLLLTGSAYLATVPAANRPPIPTDRYTFYVVPLLFVAFAAWIEGGMIREAGTAWVAAGAAVLPILAALVGVNNDPHGTENGLAFIPWIGVSAGRLVLLLPFLAAYCGLCAFLLIRPTTGAHTLIKPALTLVTITSVCAFSSKSRVACTHHCRGGWMHTAGRV